jgi:hypothetical protein
MTVNLFQEFADLLKRVARIEKHLGFEVPKPFVPSAQEPFRPEDQLRQPASVAAEMARAVPDKVMGEIVAGRNPGKLR